jgi:S-adenosylmethionine:tRNA-ribosyltransferase-isomerase (queuine synthetase)
MPNKDIIYALECKSYKTNPNYNYEHAYIFTLGTEKKHYIVYENINDRSTTTILYILYKTKDNSEEEYYDIIAAMKEYMNSTTFNKRQWFHSRPYIKKNIRGRAIEVKIRLLQHRDFSEWKRNFWDAPFYKKNDINL